MNSKKEELLSAIEVKRAEMSALIAGLSEQPLSNDAIVKISQELDLLLNQYQKLIDKSENESRNNKNV